jgi:hypothetical protein
VLGIRRKRLWAARGAGSPVLSAAATGEAVPAAALLKAFAAGEKPAPLGQDGAAGAGLEDLQ